MLVLAILYWILNKLHKLVEYVGANFENIISTKWGQWMQDSYATPWDAISASNKVWWFGQKVWTMLWVWKAWSMMWGAIASHYAEDPMLKKLKEEAKYEWVREANQWIFSNIKSETIKKFNNKWNNTKINK
jgi:hypothetical protein